MGLVKTLLDNAYEDTHLLTLNDEKGDDFSMARDVDFILYSKEESQAKIVVEFINDNQYGDASYEKIENNYRIIVTSNMPITQNIISSISALMACIAELFNIQYDGWGCTLMNKE